jgi:hypothetical protein
MLTNSSWTGVFRYFSGWYQNLRWRIVDSLTRGWHYIVAPCAIVLTNGVWNCHSITGGTLQKQRWTEYITGFDDGHLLTCSPKFIIWARTSGRFKCRTKNQACFTVRLKFVVIITRTLGLTNAEQKKKISLLGRGIK